MMHLPLGRRQYEGRSLCRDLNNEHPSRIQPSPPNIGCLAPSRSKILVSQFLAEGLVPVSAVETGLTLTQAENYFPIDPTHF